MKALGFYSSHSFSFPFPHYVTLHNVEHCLAYPFQETFIIGFLVPNVQKKIKCKKKECT